MEVIEHWITRFYFWKLYRKFRNQGWSVLSHSPDYLNIAFPDFTVQYFIATFTSDQEVTFYGQLPSTGFRYISFSTYDTQGLPHSSVNDREMILDNSRHYTLRVGKELKKPSSSVYCVIMRLYSQKVTSSIFLRYLPLVTLTQHQLIRHISDPNLSVTIQATTEVDRSLKSFLSHRSIKEFTDSDRFFIPPKSEMIAFFINSDAVYMIVVPRSNQVLKVSGILHPDVGFHSPLRFIGFMASNLQTTETDSCISDSELPKHYTFWVARSRRRARQYGYDGKHPLLLWKSSNAYPILVYREVRTNKEGLMSLRTETKRASAAACERVMGRYYPRVDNF